MAHALEGLYGQAGALLDTTEDELSHDFRDITLSVGSSRTCCSSSDSDDEAYEDAVPHSAPTAIMGVPEVKRAIARSLSRAASVLAKLDQLAARYTKDGECSISGISKFKNRVVTESENLNSALSSIANLSDNEASSSALAAAHLLARCNGMAHYEFLIDLAESEANVVGLLVTVSAAGPDSARHPLEVDLCTCSGLRWIKIRTSTASSLKSDVMNSADPKYVHQLRELCYRARHTFLPHARHPEVHIVFKASPPPALAESLMELGATVSAIPSRSGLSLPVLDYNPRFVCLDTTTLVAMCSFTAFTSVEDYSPERCLAHLERYKVLSDQVRKEQTDAVVTAHINPTLSRHTRWTTRREAAAHLEHEVASRLLALRDMGSRSRHVRPSSPSTGEATLRFPLSATDAHTWIDPLLPRDLSLTDVASCSTVREVDDERQRRADERLPTDQDNGDADAPVPNWVIADITLQEFRWMIETLAGPEEILRAAQILRNVTVVDTTCLRSSRLGSTALVTPLQCVKAGGRLLARNKVVFGMADAIGALLLTSNRQVVNAAKERGISLLVSVHPSRSLTEQKVKSLARRNGPSKPPPFEYSEDSMA